MASVRTFLDLRNLMFKRPSQMTKYVQNQIQCQKTGHFQFFSTSSKLPSRGKLHGAKPRLEPDPNSLEGFAIESGPIEASRIFKPFIFTVAFSSASFTCAAIWQYENLRKKAMEMMIQPGKWFQEKFQNRKHGRWRNQINKWWNELSEGQRIFGSLCFANVLVFLAWRIPSFKPSMIKYFCSNPASSVLCWPMVLSTFSHYSTFHIFANMYVLHSFSTGTVISMGKEQFLGFYMAAGVISSFASYAHKVLLNRPCLSLGASGAIMGVLGYTCTRYPDLEVSIIFLPFITFKAVSAIKAIIALDAMGIVLGWKFFDHAAHLGGAMFGVFWSYWGHQHIWRNREPLVSAWNSLRRDDK